ncbi:MAG TPA: DUF116 domain-containing protein, partial [Thermococcus litoralis]|nr:DUF116 domain-containing protein [Thermococcus litoralis]
AGCINTLVDIERVKVALEIGLKQEGKRPAFSTDVNPQPTP